MVIRHLRQLHVRITKECDDGLKRIAAIEGTIHSELVRQVLWRFVRDYSANVGSGDKSAHGLRLLWRETGSSTLS